MKLIPQPGFVLVKPIVDEQAGNFTVQETNLEKQQKGEVIAVGPEMINEWGTLMKTNVKKGDIVYHRSWGHETINMGGEEYRVCRFLDICLVVEL